MSAWLAAFAVAALAADGSYLSRHAKDPVAWRPWGEAAFAEARRANKPVFLSIGYSACHWCEAMGRESFSEAKTAALLNARYVPVLVDREERPDVDELYLKAAVGAGWSVGWPLNLWLTPEGEPFFGASYLPPQPRWGLPAFAPLLASLEEGWRRDPASARAKAAAAVAVLKAAPPEPGERPGPEALERAVGDFSAVFDAEQGGFLPAPKFPRPPALGFLLRRAAAGDAQALLMSTRTLAVMARRPIHDAREGGFHRYAVGADWSRPHTEKMLGDNAQLAALYAEAFQLTREELFAEIGKKTLAFLSRELALPGGGFASALAADEAYYAGARTGKKPRRDEKLLTDVNGLAIAAFARGAQAFGEPVYLETARRAARALRERAYDAGSNRLRRHGAAAGLAADYAYLTQGLLDLYEASRELEWLSWAVRLSEAQLELFYDARKGGFYQTAEGQDGALLARLMPDADDAVPAPGSAAALNLLRLSRLTGREDFAAAAEKTLQRHAAALAQSPRSLPWLLAALDQASAAPRRLVIVGEPGDAGAQALWKAAQGRFLPRTALIGLDEKSRGAFAVWLPLTKGMGPLDGKAAAYACEGTACRLPTSDPAELSRLLGR